MSQLINILLAKDKYNGCDINNYYYKPKEGLSMKRKILTCIATILCIIMAVGCGNKSTTDDGIDMLIDGNSFRYKPYPFGYDFAKAKSDNELRSENEVCLALQDEVTILGEDGGIIQLYSDSNSHTEVIGVAINFLYTDGNALEESQKVYDRMFEELLQNAPSDCETLDKRTKGDLLHVTDSNDSTITRIAPIYVWTDSQGNTLSLSMLPYSDDYSTVIITLTRAGHTLIAH